MDFVWGTMVVDKFRKTGINDNVYTFRLNHTENGQMEVKYFTVLVELVKLNDQNQIKFINVTLLERCAP